jgi:hypothetical protein
VKDGQIGQISIKNNSVVLGMSTGMIIKYATNGLRVLPQRDASSLTCLQADGAITSLVMDDLNVEGVCGTASGNLYYLNIAEE